jgi:hypothetical protein
MHLTRPIPSFDLVFLNYLPKIISTVEFTVKILYQEMIGKLEEIWFRFLTQSPMLQLRINPGRFESFRYGFIAGAAGV